MHYDDGVRARVGLAVCLQDMGDGTSRLIFDDVVATGDGIPTDWSHCTFFTRSGPISTAEIEEMSVDRQVLEDIGIAVLARLWALHESPPPPRRR